MTLKIIGAGFRRTGTESTKMALNELGLKCYDMTEVIKAGRAAMRRWINAADDPSSADWGTIFVGYDATVDWPGAYFWEEFMEHYPNAKGWRRIRSQIGPLSFSYQLLLNHTSIERASQNSCFNTSFIQLQPNFYASTLLKKNSLFFFTHLVIKYIM